MKQGAAIMPEALRWLWRDYPNPIVVQRTRRHRHSPAGIRAAKSTPSSRPTNPGSRWAKPTAPSPAPPATRTATSSSPIPPPTASTSRTPIGKVTVFKDNSDGARALARRARWPPVRVAAARSRIVSYGPGGDEKVVAQNVDAADLAITAKGEIYFTDADPQDRRPHRRQWPDARRLQRRRNRAALRTRPLPRPGHAHRHRCAVALQLVLSDRRRWLADQRRTLLSPGNAGNRMDERSAGRSRWIPSARSTSPAPLGVQVCEANGRVAAILNPPEPGGITALTFAGKDLDWLYVAEGNKLFRRATKVKGRPGLGARQTPASPALNPCTTGLLACRSYAIPTTSRREPGEPSRHPD